MNNKSFVQKTKWKLIWTIGISIVVWLLSGLIGFPRIFQWMFIGYVIGGFLFFILLDARPMKEKKGGAAVFSVIIFYIVLSFSYTVNGYLWPQYDPQEEKAKIAKLMKNVVTPEQRVKELEATVGELTKKIEEMQAHPGAVSGTAPAEVAKKGGEKPSAGASSALIAKGREVYDLYECYNCHKVGGKGGVKRRGPELDNVGKEFTADQLKKRILYPYAAGTKATKGFEKEFDEQVMPDYYPEQISKEELNDLVAYLFSLKK